MVSEGTTPRRLTDLIGSLCDLTSGSGDKGTPIVYIQATSTTIPTTEPQTEYKNRTSFEVRFFVNAQVIRRACASFRAHRRRRSAMCLELFDLARVHKGGELRVDGHLASRGRL